MKNTGTLQLTTPTDLEIVMTRVFDAPRRLVFEALTKPELLRRWFFGPPGWSLAVCEIDLKAGGEYRYVWRGPDGTMPDGTMMAVRGVFREVVPPERIVQTETFDEAWYPGQAFGKLVLVEQDGRTTLTLTMTYESREARDAVLKTPMEQGVAAGYDRLAEILPSMNIPENPRSSEIAAISIALTRQELFNAVRNEVRVLLHLASKAEPPDLDYRPAPGQRSMLELLQYMTIMPRIHARFVAADTFDFDAWRNMWRAEEAAAKKLGLDEIKESIGGQPAFFAEWLGSQSDTSLRAEIEMFGRRASRGSMFVNLVLCHYTAYRMQLFLYLKACGHAGLNTLNLWAGMDAG